jgi:uncharacterized membrane protein
MFIITMVTIIAAYILGLIIMTTSKVTVITTTDASVINHMYNHNFNTVGCFIVVPFDRRDEAIRILGMLDCMSAISCALALKISK